MSWKIIYVSKKFYHYTILKIQRAEHKWSWKTGKGRQVFKKIIKIEVNNEIENSLQYIEYKLKIQYVL